MLLPMGIYITDSADLANCVTCDPRTTTRRTYRSRTDADSCYRLLQQRGNGAKRQCAAKQATPNEIRWWEPIALRIQGEGWQGEGTAFSQQQQQVSWSWSTMYSFIGHSLVDCNSVLMEPLFRNFYIIPISLFSFRGVLFDSCQFFMDPAVYSFCSHVCKHRSSLHIQIEFCVFSLILCQEWVMDVDKADLFFSHSTYAYFQTYSRIFPAATEFHTVCE